jgi:hypothetical protein
MNVERLSLDAREHGGARRGRCKGGAKKTQAGASGRRACLLCTFQLLVNADASHIGAAAWRRYGVVFRSMNMFAKQGRRQPRAAEQGSGSEQGSLIWIAVWVCAILTGGCTQRIANADEASPMLSSEPSKATLAVLPEIRANAIGEEPTVVGDAELRRGYGAVDMRYHPCITPEGENALSGSDCPAGFTIYGPYVSVPANSEIEVSFELSASKPIEVYADIVSQMAVQTLAGLNRQKLPTGAKQSIGYRVHVFNEDVNVESRIGFSGDHGIEFRISDLTMTVR